MGDVRTSFVVLEDVASQAGRPWHAAVAGDAAAGKNAGPVLPVKDENGNLQYLPMIGGAIQVTNEGVVAGLSTNGLVAGSATYVAVATLTLTPSAAYKGLSLLAACSRDARFKIEQVDDMTTTILVQGIVIAKESTVPANLDGLEFTAGASGTQSLVIKALNLNALSDLSATIATKEIQ